MVPDDEVQQPQETQTPTAEEGTPLATTPLASSPTAKPSSSTTTTGESESPTIQDKLQAIHIQMQDATFSQATPTPVNPSLLPAHNAIVAFARLCIEHLPTEVQNDARKIVALFEDVVQ